MQETIDTAKSLDGLEYGYCPAERAGAEAGEAGLRTINGEWNVNSGDGWVTGVFEDDVQPTYWMPLPEPPKMERGYENAGNN